MRAWLVILALAAVAAAGAVAATAPSLRIIAQNPLRIEGRAFQPAEVVRVALRQGGAAQVKTVRATAASRFVIAFLDVAIERCGSGFSVSAIGRAGSRAFLKRPPMECPEQLAAPDSA